MNISVMFRLLVIFAIASPAFARTDCLTAKVYAIQVEGNSVLFQQESAPWRYLGDVTTAGTNERLSQLLAAQMAGRKVMVGYASDSYDCSATNYGGAGAALLVRTFNE